MKKTHITLDLFYSKVTTHSKVRKKCDIGWDKKYHHSLDLTGLTDNNKN